MLACLTDPAFGEYETWLRISFAVYAATDSTCFEIWDRWCQKRPHYNAAENARKWETFQSDRPDRIGIGTLVHYARQRGYQAPPDAFHWTFPTLAPEDLTRLNVIARAAAARERSR
jgi:hypothetical protein